MPQENLFQVINVDLFIAIDHCKTGEKATIFHILGKRQAQLQLIHHRTVIFKLRVPPQSQGKAGFKMGNPLASSSLHMTIVQSERKISMGNAPSPSPSPPTCGVSLKSVIGLLSCSFSTPLSV